MRSGEDELDLELGVRGDWEEGEGREQNPTRYKKLRRNWKELMIMCLV